MTESSDVVRSPEDSPDVDWPRRRKTPSYPLVIDCSDGFIVVHEPIKVWPADTPMTAPEALRG